MIFVDTNYFLRYLLQDDQKQYQIAKQLFLAGSRGTVKLMSSTVVFFEIYWVLKSYYSVPKNKLLQTLESMLRMQFVRFYDRDILEKTIKLFDKTTLSLEDCYNLSYAKVHSAGGFKTFDKKLEKEFHKKQ